MSRLKWIQGILDSLNDGGIIRKSMVAALRVLGVLIAIGGVVAVLTVLKYSFQPETTTEATLGGILYAIVLLVGFFATMQIPFYRARSVKALAESPFPVVPVVSILFRLAGEVYATLAVTAGVGGCVFVWLAKSSPLVLLGPIRGFLPAAVREESFAGGLLLLASLFVAAFLAMVVCYFCAEMLLVFLDIDSNLRLLTGRGAGAPAHSFCRVCNAELVPGSTFCGNCGTRL
jgi:uncharacterized membrane protein required for colicin V production